jgi:hypothetical protein
MRGKQCKCKSFNAKSSVSLRQLRLVSKVGKRGQLKLQQEKREKLYKTLQLDTKELLYQTSTIELDIMK